jgi:hypothetical protein
MKFSSDPAGRKQASALCNELYALRERLRRLDLLAAPLEAGLKELLGRLTDFVNPYSTEELDKWVKGLDEKFPDWVHGYTRSGTGVTWHDRPRSPEHPLWDLYPH